MRSMKTFAVALSLSILVAGSSIFGAAMAQEPDEPVKRLNIPGIGMVPYQKLFEDHSRAGESLDQFMSRIGPRLRAYSDRTGYEACGVIARGGDTYGVIVGTNHAHIACVNAHSFVPAGMTSINETIHSHGGERPFRPNRADKALMGEFLLAKPGDVSARGQTLDAFSPVDFSGGPGYLAIPFGRLLHQSGQKGTIREVHIEGDHSNPAEATNNVQ